MKRYLHFYIWLAAVIMMICSTLTMPAMTKVTSLSDLKVGNVIKIYPKSSNGTSHYAESKLALACSGNNQYLTSYEKAGSGDSWVLEDAGDGYYYLKNDLGCYWAYQSKSSYNSLTCTTYKSTAVKISLTWDSKYNGVCFWNQKDGTGLNNLNGYNYRYNWYSSKSDYNSSDANTTFDVAIVQEGEAYIANGIKYLVNQQYGTATVLPNSYHGDIVIPQYVKLGGIVYRVKALGEKCFYYCSELTSVSLPISISMLGDMCFAGTNLKSITLPNSVEIIGSQCFAWCSSLENISLPNSIRVIGNGCFNGCEALKSVKLPNNITSLGSSIFERCTSLTSITFPEKITSLGNWCFYNCTSLTSVYIPAGVTSLGNKCFYGCTSLKELSLPASLKNIGENVMDNIDNNIIISCLAQTPPENTNKDFINSKHRLFVPSESLEKYKSSSPWSNAYSINPLYPVTSIILPAEASVVTEKTTTLNLSVLPENAGSKSVTWSSENPDVASVDANGVITGKKVGTTKITATATDGTEVSASTNIKVLMPVESITFAEKKISITKTKSTTVSITVNPTEAGNKNVTWTSSNENVATVVQSTRFEAIVTGKKVGKAIIKAEAQDGSGVCATCEAEVTPLQVSDFTAKTISAVKTIPTKMEMDITPTEADNQNFKWKSLTPEIATITEDGTVTGLKMGTAKLQAVTTDGSNISKTFDVQVTGLPVSTISMPKEYTIVKTENGKLEYSILPTASDNQTLKWSSNAPAIASVDETFGVITANKVGDAIITATATDGSGISTSTTIHVTPLKVDKVVLNNETLKVLWSTTETLTASVAPERADNKTLKWTSDNENIATVTQEGVVKGVNVGTANITATTTDGSNLSATCKVTVTPVTIDLSTKTINLQQGATYSEQKVTVLPDNYEHKEVSWSSSDPSVASIDANGKIKANKPGIATIRYVLNKDNSIYADCKVIVYAPSVVYVGGLYYLLDGKSNTATVTGIYGANGNGLDASRVAQYYSGTINIPRSVTYNGITYDVTNVGSYSFACQNDLQSIFIPTSVKTVERSASTKAEKLQMVNVEEESQLVNIGENAFKECTGLRFFTFEGTTMKMKSIDASAFYGCSKLERVKWVGKSTLMTIGDYAFYKCISLNNFAMPNSVLSVGNYSFRYCAGLTNVSLSSTLSIIYEYAFGECGFSHITLPESLVSVQAGSFINNQYLEDITFPARMEGIGSAAFENNASLGTVTFKTEINTMTIGDNAFNLCPVLSKVNIEHLDSWAHTNFKNAKANPANTSHNIYMNEVEIIDVVLPTGTRYVNNNAFNGCSHIKSLSMPATIDRINDNIIYGCSNLKDVYCYATEVPPFIGTQDPAEMDDVFKAATLHVIYGNENAYKADSWWGRFAQVAGCNAPAPDPIKVESITISQTEATLKPDDTIQLTATVYPTNADNKKVNWKSSNENVAMVTDEGFVLALAEGTSDIIAEAADGSGIKAVCKITVEKKPSPDVKLSLIEFVNSAVTIEQGKSVLLGVNYYPENATNKQLAWTSTRTGVATVNDKGIVTAVGEGKTIITAKSTDGTSLSINCVVTVTPATGIGNITMSDVKLVIKDRHLKVEGLADNDIVQIINTIGFTVYKGTEHEIDLKAAGVYIIKVKGKTLKFSVK